MKKKSHSYFKILYILNATLKKKQKKTIDSINSLEVITSKVTMKINYEQS